MSTFAGCSEGMAEYLPGIVPGLLQCMKDSKPLVRSITCWTMSRYSAWIVLEDPNAYFKPFLGEVCYFLVKFTTTVLSFCDRFSSSPLVLVVTSQDFGQEQESAGSGMQRIRHAGGGSGYAVGATPRDHR